VPLDEGAALVRRVGDVEAEKCELRVILLELCVGDRLALAGASPRRPDVHEHWLPPEVGQGGVLPVERGSFDRWRCWTRRRVLGSSGLRDRRTSGRSSFVVGAAPAARDEEGAEGQEER